MTVGALISIITGAIAIIIGVIFAINSIIENDSAAAIISMLIGLVLGGLFIGGAIFYLNTESGKRAIKDLESEMNNGISRTVSVYDVQGELIKEYSGKFDVETGNSSGAPYIKFDDEKGKRHIVYYTTGTILIDEK
jgi:hypothetical protein